ncbi:MAG: T9SS type A sorting domain-containing protein [Cyclobacteriaceae bacterium]|nr:T9SS type A sorting domain-containing protein [Cyclobacteriaceae bacterium]MCH8516818.1 T9SS type A sorting domain-containing protein [Cyclobacteriaceae bacterium]
MKSLLLGIILLFFSSLLYAQVDIDFEENGSGADFTWAVFENADNPPLEIIDNPFASGINTSSKVAMFTAREEGAPFAGVESANGDIGPFTLSSSNSRISIMVYKTVISDVGLKFAISNTGAQEEIKVANTQINEWERLEFDFSPYIGLVEAIDITQIIIFPDFQDRDQENIVYFDNITFEGQEMPISAAPMPEVPASDVLSILSDAYDDVAGTNFNPNWGQNTIVSFVDIEGSNTMKYENLNYQGIELASAIDVSDFNLLHIDFWTADATDLSLFLISPGPQETGFSLDIVNSEWVSVDIDLSVYDEVVDLEDVIQMKFEGNGTVFIDNLYFHSTNASNNLNAPIDFEANGFGADFDWNVFENADNPDLEIVANPDPSGINTSSTVAKFTARAEGAPFAGVESANGDIGLFSLNEQNSIVKIMVYKTEISDVGLKFAINDGGAQPEILVSNTVINEWEELTFDFSGNIGLFEAIDIDQIIVFPDYRDRDEEKIVYFDNITFSAVSNNGETASLPSLPLDFESADLEYAFVNFEGGVTEVISNPFVEGINTSDNVARMVKNEGAIFAGSLLELNEPIDFSESKTFSVKVYSPRADAKLLLKVENADNPAINFEVEASATIANEWEEITFDYSDINTAEEYSKLVFIFDLGTVGDGSENFTYYFDDVLLVGDEDATGPESQTITFDPIADIIEGSEDFTVSATATSDLAVSFTTTSENIQIDGASVSLISAGRASVVASQEGNEDFSAAESVTQSFCVVPMQPTISTENNEDGSTVLVSSAAEGNQWYLDGALIEGATNNRLTTEASGSYTTQVTVDDCVSEMSEAFVSVVTSTNEGILSKLTVYPNPTNGMVHLKASAAEITTLQLYDMSGSAQVTQLKQQAAQASIDISHLPFGVYILKVALGDEVHQIRVIKN